MSEQLLEHPRQEKLVELFGFNPLDTDNGHSWKIEADLLGFNFRFVAKPGGLIRNIRHSSGCNSIIYYKGELLEGEDVVATLEDEVVHPYNDYRSEHSGESSVDPETASNLALQTIHRLSTEVLGKPVEGEVVDEEKEDK